MLGLRGFRIESDDQIEQVLDEALAADGPVLIDAVVDPNIPPLPPEPRQQVIDNLEKALDAEPDEQQLRDILEREGVLIGPD